MQFGDRIFSCIVLVMLAAPASAWHWEIVPDADVHVCYLATHCEIIDSYTSDGPFSVELGSSSACCENTTAASLEMDGGVFRYHASLTARGTDHWYGALGVASIKATVVAVADPGDMPTAFVHLNVSSVCDPYLGFHDDNGVHGEVVIGACTVVFDRTGGDGPFLETVLGISISDGDTLRIHDPDYYSPFDAGIKLEQDIEPENCDFDMSAELLIVATIYGEGSTAVPGIASRPQLYPASPNPFNPRTSLRFELPRCMAVSLDIRGVNGQRVRTLVDNRFLCEGSHAFDWDGRDQQGRLQAAGVYVAHLSAGEFERLAKLVFVK